MGSSYSKAGEDMTNSNTDPLSSLLEMRCAYCNGRGWRRSGDEQDRCVSCQGAGYVPTESGKRILALMRHNFRPMLRDSVDD